MDPTPSPRGLISRDHVIRVLRLYVEVRELSNYWIEIRKWGVILEQVYFHEEIVPTMVLRLARKLGIPPELFWDPAAVDRYDR